MPNAAQFFQAARCRPPVVLRRQLVEFTLGHYLYLSEADSPFLPESTPRPPAPLDLFLAVHICSGPIARKRNLLNLLLFRWWVATCSFLEFSTEAKRFAEYVSNAFKAPKITTDEGAFKPSNTPHVCSLFGVLMERFNQPFSEVENIPLEKARWLEAVYLDHHGTLRIWDDRRKELWEAAKRFDEEELNGVGNG